MRRTVYAVALFVAALAVLAPAALAQNLRLVYIQTHTVTNATTVAACTAASTPANCDTDVATVQMYCTVETNPIRWFANGTAPTTTVGHLANAGATVAISGAHVNVANFQMIATGSNATVTCTVIRP